MNQSLPNPYIGARTFSSSPEDQARYFGRNAEANKLLSLVLMHRLVLFYASSGAGKSSLIRARLIGDLEAENFTVLPIARVIGHTDHSQTNSIQPHNVFIFNLISCLDPQADPQALTNLTLTEYLKTHHQSEAASEDDFYKPARLLIIDQFEEIIYAEQAHWNQREAFFKQLAQAMENDPLLWVLLSMRDDYVAPIEPYAHLLPGKLRIRYYMQRMRESAALQAIQKPAEQYDIKFSDAAARKLVDDLRQIRISGHTATVPDEFIEPVQLQVVCHALWNELKPVRGQTITEEDVEAYADVDKMLGKYYDRVINEAAAKTRTRANVLRKWFGEKLITEADTRALVYRREGETGANTKIYQAADWIAKEYFILRIETRAGGEWYELVHDRFIPAIRKSNQLADQRRTTSYLALCLAIVVLIFSSVSLFQFTENQNISGTATSVQEQANNIIGTATSVQEQANTIRGAEANIQEQANNVRGVAETLEAELQGELAAKETTTAQAVNMSTMQASISSTATATKMATEAWQANDIDGDGLSNGFEEAINTDPNHPDSDRDTLSDGEEVNLHNSNPRLADTDDDGLEDRDELNYGTNLLQPDTDGDGLTDGIEIARGTDPLLPDHLATSDSADSGTLEPPQSETLETVSVATPTSQLINLQLTLDAVAASLPTERGILLGQSVQGQPIEATRFGSGERVILFIGSLHGGYAPSGVDIAERLIDHLESNLDDVPSEATIYIVPNLNPDGINAPALVEGRLNANKVDMNRNWDCMWAAESTFGNKDVDGGSEPMSEPETQALAQFIETHQPVAVVVWTASALDGLVSPGECEGRSEAAHALAETFADAANYTAQSYESVSSSGQPVQGDATNWMDTLDIPAISVLLPGPRPRPAYWTSNLEGIRAVLQTYGGD